MQNSNTKVNQDSDFSPNPIIGLIECQSRQLIPLKSIDAIIEIEENYAKVSLTHNYTNTSDNVIDCSFNFPKTDGAVFYSLKVKQGEKEIVAIVDSKVRAKAKFQEATESGETCVLSEVGHKFFANSVVTTKIGNFMPGENMNITYSYLEKLSVSMNKYFKFILPATLTRRYIKNSLSKSTSKNENSVDGINSFKSEENLNEFSDEYKNSKISYLKGEDVLAYTWNIKAIINSSSPIGNVTISSGHPVFIEYSSDFKNASISLDTDKSKIPNGDFVLLFENKDLLTPKIKLFKHPEYSNDYALNISFNPIHSVIQRQYQKLIENSHNSVDKLKNEEEFYKTFNEKINDTNSFKGSFLFFIDRSGSMANLRITMAKRALKIFLKSLNPGSYYNIVSFGSNYEQMYSNLIEANDENTKESISNVNKFRANMGGTEILDALKNTMSQYQESSKEMEMRVFILTDGAVADTEKVLNFVKSVTENPKIKFFSLGVGNGCSFDLVNGIANNGAGLSEFAESEMLITEKTVFLLESSMKPSLSKYSLTTNDPKITKQLIKNDVQGKIKENYMLGDNFEFLTRFHLGKEKLSNDALTINFAFKFPVIFQNNFMEDLNNKNLTEISVKLNINEAEISDVFHKIWANAHCKKNPKDVETALKYSILYKKTALFCIIKENELTVEQLRKKRQVEIQSQAPIDYWIRVYVKTLTGKTLTILCEPHETVESLKDKVEEEEGIPSYQQTMICNGMLIEDYRTLSDYKIKDESTVHLVLRLRGSDPEYKAKVFYNDNFLFEYITGDSFAPLMLIKLESLKRIEDANNKELTFLSESREVIDTSLFKKKINELQGQIGNVIYIYDTKSQEDMRIKGILNDEAVIVEMQKMSGEWAWDANIQKIFLFDEPEKMIQGIIEKYPEFEKIIEKEDAEKIRNAIFTLFMKVYLEKRFRDKLNELKLILNKAENFAKNHLLDKNVINHLEDLFKSKVEASKLY